MMKNLPNILTLSRISLIPIFIIVYYLPIVSAHILATILFALASITDLVDGYLARRWHIESDLGAFLDPVADKLLVTVALILVLTGRSAWLAIPVAIIIGREIMISAVREWMAHYNLRNVVAVNTIGKYKTTVQMFAVGSLIFYTPELQGIWVLWVGYISIYISAILTLWSMLVYLLAAWRALKQHSAAVLS